MSKKEILQTPIPGSDASPQDTLAAIGTIAETTGLNAFRVSVLRKSNLSAFPVDIATLDDVTTAQITHAQLWLPVLAGGGQYMLRVFHMDSLDKPIGGYVALAVEGTPRQVSASVHESQAWKALGLNLVSPAKPQAPAPVMTIAAREEEFQLPTSRTLSAAAPPAPVPTASPYAADLAAIQAEREKLRAENERLAARDRQAREDQHRQELELLRKSQQAEMDRIRFEMAEQARQAQAAATAPKGPSITEILAVIAPLVGNFLQSTKEAQMKLAEMQTKSAEKLAEMQAAQAKEMRELITKATEKKEDPLLAKLIEKSMNQGNEVAQMMSAMSSVVGQATSTMLTMVTQARELIAPAEEPESPLMKLAGMMAPAITALASKGSVAVTPPPPPPAQAMVPAPQSTQFAGMDPEEAQALDAEAAEMTVFEEIVARIRSLERPVEPLVAYYFEQVMSDPDLNARVRAVGGNIFQAFTEPLQAGGWIMDPVNQAYLRDELVPAFQAMNDQLNAQAQAQAKKAAPRKAKSKKVETPKTETPTETGPEEL